MTERFFLFFFTSAAFGCVPRFPIGQGSRYLGRRGRRGGGTSRAVRSRSCWRQEPEGGQTRTDRERESDANTRMASLSASIKWHAQKKREKSTVS